MPELPEVETVARDLRPRLVGATIVGARTNWARTLRSQDPIAFADGVAGRTVLSVGRRAKQLVVDLSGDAALTIHLKMTGQLFVVPADRPEDPYIRLVLELADGRELRFRDIRKFGKIGLYGRDPVSGELVEEVGGSAVFAALGPGTARPDVHAPGLPQTDPAAQGPAQAAAHRPVVPGRRREHLRRRGAVAGTPPPAAVREVAAPAGRAPPVRGDPRGPVRGRGAARLLDRRLHGTGRRRLDAGDARRSTSAPASRVRAAAARSSGSSSVRGPRTSARGVSACRPRIAQARGRSSGP